MRVRTRRTSQQLQPRHRPEREHEEASRSYITGSGEEAPTVTVQDCASQRFTTLGCRAELGQKETA